MGRTGFDVLHRMLLATSCLVAAPLIAASSALAAGPSGGTVVAGQATVTTPSSTSTVITQTSSRALINWNSFSISAGSTVTFDQPGSKSITVNRVTGTGASDIYGDLFANGRIWLINANGILFGKGSEINVGALIATTSDITDSDFRKGHYNFGTASTNSAASVVNQGTIVARDHGSVVLSAASVSNQGIIQANLGTVVLGGADAFTVDLKGDNLIRYQVTAPVSKTPTAADGSPAAALVSNSGTIEANGGKVLMTARAAHSVEDNVINNSGIVEATSVSSHNGEIDLNAGTDGTVDDSGTLDVSGKGAGQTGGTVEITGGTVNVLDGAHIDASGDAGGGNVSIGGDFHGKGPLRDANQTNIGNASIDVDAITKGNGGNVAIWANTNTTFAGTISAKGGAHGGNGGYVETSGGSVEIGLNGFVNTSAVAGKTGDWLIDPENIVIATGGGTSLTGGTLGLGTDPDSTDTIAPSTITTALQAGTDVTLEASNDITVSNDVIYSSANTFSLLAENSILVNANIENTKASGGGNINLIAGWDGTTLPPASLTAPGAYGAENEEGQGTILIGEDASGGIAIGSASGLTTVAGTDITLQSNDGYTQIGYHGTGGGGIVVDATDDLTLNSGEGSGLYAQIGNGDASGTNETIGNVGGDIDIHIANDSEFNGATPWIGNVAGVGATETGNVTLVTYSSEFVPGGFLTADLGSAPGTGGNVTVGFMSSADNFIGDLSYSSPNDFTWLTGGNLNVIGSIVNSGTGAITLVAGWDGKTLGTASQLQAAGAYGANGAIMTIGGEGEFPYGDVDVGSAGGTTTVLSGDLTLEADTGYAQLGYHGTSGGDINVDLTGDLTLTGNSESPSEYAQIGSGDASGGDDGIGSVTGNISLDVGGTVDLTGYSGDGGGIAWLGNVAGAQGTNPIESGNFTLIMGDENDNGDADLGSMIAANLGSTSSPGSGGNVTIGFTAPDEDNTIIDRAGTVDSPNALTILSAGNINIESTFENQGTGALTFVSGWNPDVITAGDVINTVSGDHSLVTLFTGAAGSYGHDGGSVTIGGEDAEGDASVGSAGGTTTVLTDNLTVEADNGIAQLGYGGVGTGDINVSALGDVTVDAATNDYAQIGNGGIGVSGAIGGNIDVVAGGDITIEDIADADENYGVAAIGNVGDAGSSQSGNVIVNATGALDLKGEGSASDAFIGNAAINETSGGATGDVTVTAASVDIDADGSVAQAFIGDGLRFMSDGASGGDISVTTGTLTLLADATDENSSEARIANRGSGAVSGDITVDTTGDIELMATDDNLAAIGNGEGGDGTTSGTIGVQSGGTISLIAQDAGEARIAAGDAPDTDINVTAAGDITLSVTGTPEELETGLQPGIALIGNFNGDTDGGNIDVTSTGGAIDLTASEASSLVQIGNSGISGASGTVTVTASDTDHGDVGLTAAGAGSSVTIGDGGPSAVGGATGDVSVSAGDTVALTASGQNSSAQIGDGGIAASGDYSGTITVDAADLTMAGTGNSSDAQIGNGGLASSGSASGTINVTIADAITMSADGNFGAAEIGNGGPLSNEDTASGFSDTGNITVSAGDITLDGSGTSSDVSIGNGGVFAGSAANIESGSIAFGGTVDVSATNSLTLDGSSDFSSAWIGNGGEGSVLDAILDGGSVTTSGAIDVTVGTDDAIGALVMDAEGQGSDARIGNGGIFGADANVTASGGVSEGGTVDVAVLGGGSGNGTAMLTASGETALVQIGNGDPAQNSGSVSGDTGLTVDGAITLVSAADTEGNLIGNAIQPSGGLSGDVTIDAQSLSGDLGFSIANDLPGGDFTVALTGDDTLAIGSDADYSSDHTLSLTNGGNIEFDGAVQNAGSGDIDIAAGGDVLIGGEGASGDVAVGSAGGTLTLTADNITVEADNGYAQLGYHGSGGGDIFATASGGITLTAEQGVPSFYAMIGNGSLNGDVGGLVTGDIYLSTPGNLEFNTCQDCGTPAPVWIGNHANSDGVESGNLTVLVGDEDDNCDSDDCADGLGTMIQAALGSSDIEGSGGNVTVGFTNPNDHESGALSIDDGFTYDSPNNLTILSATSIGVGGSLENAGTGDITLVAGWNTGAVTQADIFNAVQNDNSLVALFTGTPNSYGQTNNDDPNHGSIQIGGSDAGGNVAVGSAGGTTTMLTDNLIVEADNGFAQLGYNGGGSGAIAVDALGNVSLTGGGASGQYAQIGNGGLLTSGDEGGDIAINAGGTVTLTGGAGQEAYVQIGNGGAEANKDSAGYTNSGAITIDGESVALLAGGGTDAYAQIGNGGYDVGDGLTGTGTNTGDITIAAVESVSLTGGGTNGYAQIGNGGSQVNANAAASASGANSGDIMVTVSDVADGSVDLTAGSGAASYVQIGNGGYASDAPTTALPSSFTDSGSVTVSDLTMIGSDTGANGYAQIGNGDASDNNVGDISGDINILSPDSIVVDNGTAPGASATIGGATGDGTVTGGIDGYTPPAPPGGTQLQTSTVASLTTQTPTPAGGGTDIVISTPITGPDGTGTGGTGSTDDTTSAPSPIQQMADASDGGDSGYEGTQPSDTVTVSLGQSLNSGSGGHTKPGATVTHTIIPGMLKQVVMVGTSSPHGVPPADQDYSSWGNEALWQW